MIIQIIGVLSIASYLWYMFIIIAALSQPISTNADLIHRYSSISILCLIAAAICFK